MREAVSAEIPVAAGAGVAVVLVVPAVVVVADLVVVEAIVVVADLAVVDGVGPPIDVGRPNSSISAADAAAAIAVRVARIGSSSPRRGTVGRLQSS